MDSEDADSLSPSETLRDNDDTNSLYSITPSLANELYRFSPVANGDKFQSLNDYYFVPFNEHTRELEELAIEYIQAFNDGKLYREPEGQAGAVEKLLGSQTDEPGRVLDLGCGTRGHWSTSIAAQFPEAEVIGVDLAPSETEFSPPNFSFEVYDVTLGIPFPDDYFSVVHSSYLTPFIPNFAKLVSEVARSLVSYAIPIPHSI
ncbi:S-adenosyl-L-methionine-dependent methyltransferase [Mrakia frigida]|uniref:S-adenosyl-L-methionine-dependent methyltransferase n=1 Tax=Mrakia frigida TaxID=29902 RepID=UPI003FCC0FBE